MFKTALMIDAASQPRERTVVSSHYSYLFEQRKPPRSVTLLLGRYVPGFGQQVVSTWGGTEWLPKLPDGNRRGEAYRVTFSVGHAIFQTHGFNVAHDDESFVVRPEFFYADGRKVPDTFRQLWPPTEQPHVWPPTGIVFDTPGLLSLAPGPGERGPGVQRG
jgi:hypothetical protein